MDPVTRRLLIEFSLVCLGSAAVGTAVFLHFFDERGSIVLRAIVKSAQVAAAAAVALKVGEWTAEALDKAKDKWKQTRSSRS